MNRLLLYVLLATGCGVANSGRVPEVSESACPPSGGHRDPTGARTFDSTEVDRDALVADDVPGFHSPVRAGPQTHFIPAELHGCKVRVWARWPFSILSGMEVQT